MNRSQEIPLGTVPSSGSITDYSIEQLVFVANFRPASHVYTALTAIGSDIGILQGAITFIPQLKAMDPQFQPTGE